jgi:hypothetical protein
VKRSGGGERDERRTENSRHRAHARIGLLLVGPFDFELCHRLQADRVDSCRGTFGRHSERGH